MSKNTESKQTESEEKKQLSILETIAEYSGTGNMSGSQYYEKIMKDAIAFLEEQRKKDYSEKK